MRARFTSLAVFLVIACNGAPAPAPHDEPSAAVAPVPAPAPEPAPADVAKALTRVEPSQVCMVNNQFMGKPQIPVEVEGKTYFGCCEMCKSRLAQDPTSRAATDPVSGANVDKASAVIGRDASGNVVYFENEKNLAQYASR
jgi:YHS domain-containing protein